MALRISKASGKKFGDAADPLLVSVRSGARVSMPGMMDTVLNLGLNDETVEGLAASSGDARFAWDSYRRFIQMYSDVVLGLDHHLFEDALEIAKEDAAISPIPRWRRKIGRRWSRNTSNWSRPNGASHSRRMCTSNCGARSARCLIQLGSGPRQGLSPPERHSRRLGHRGQRAGDGVRQHGRYQRHRRRLHPRSGDRRERLLRRMAGQRAGRGRGRRYPHAAISDQGGARDGRGQAAVDGRGDAGGLCRAGRRVRSLEKHYRDMQDIEFTVERGKLWMLQTRSGKRTAKAALKMAVDMAAEGLIDEDEAILRVDPMALDQLLHPTLDPDAPRDVLTKGLPASPGAASGADRVRCRYRRTARRDGRGGDPGPGRNQPRRHPRHARGARHPDRAWRHDVSHAAVVARGMGRPCVSGAGGLSIDMASRSAADRWRELKEGDMITLDGTTGEVMAGRSRRSSPNWSAISAR